MTTVPLITTPGSTSPVADSSELAWRLLDENRYLSDLLQSATLRSTAPRIVLYLRPVEGAFHDLAGWAAQFGGTIVGSTTTDDAGGRWRSCRVSFEFLGERIEVCAHVPAGSVTDA